MLNNIFVSIIVPFFVSLLAAYVFWIFSFKYTNIEIVFSDQLEKRKDVRVGRENQYRHRIRISNFGITDLFEVYLIAKLVLKTPDGRNCVTYFPVGEEGTIPVFVKKYDRKKRNEYKETYKKTGIWRRSTVYTYGIYANEMAYNEYSKSFYEESIIKKAKEKTLVIDDIFQVYPDALLTVFVFGNDPVTGARHKYESKAYTNRDIKEGRFHRFSGILWPEGRILISRKKERELLKEEMSKIDNPQEVLKEFLSFPIDSSEEILKLFSRESGIVVHKGDNKGGFAYFRGNRKDRVLLVAHADDRAGCAMLYLLLSSGHSVLVLDGEEHSQIGAHYLKDSYPEIYSELNEHQYIIQLDCRSTKEYKFDNIPVSEEFREFIEKEFSYKDTRIKARTDIVVLCDKICGVNLSVGYYHEYTPQEKLCYEEWLHTYEILAKVLEQKQKQYLLSSEEVPCVVEKGDLGNLES